MIFIDFKLPSGENIVKKETYIGNDVSLVAIDKGKEENSFNFLFMVHQDQDDSFIFVEVSAVLKYERELLNILEHNLYKDNIKKSPNRSKVYEDVISNIKSTNCYKSSFKFEDTEKNNYKRCTLIRAVDGQHYVSCTMYVNLNMFFMINMFKMMIGSQKDAERVLSDHNLNTMSLIEIDYIEIGSSTIYDDKIHTHYVVHCGITGFAFTYITPAMDYTIKDLIEPMDDETYKIMYENDSIVKGVIYNNDIIYIAIYGDSFISNNPLGRKFKEEKKEYRLLGIKSNLCRGTNLIEINHNVIKGE